MALLFNDSGDEDDLMEICHAEQITAKEKEVQRYAQISEVNDQPTAIGPVSLTTTAKSPLIQKRSRLVASLEQQQEEEEKIPGYLLGMNTIFEQIIRTAPSNVATSTNIEMVRQIAILIHQCTTIDLEKSLLLTFLKYNTGTLQTTDEMGPRYWPEKLKSMIKSMKSNQNVGTSRDENDLDVIQTHLRQLKDREQHYEIKLMEKTKSIYNFDTTIEPILRTFIRRNLHALKMENEYEIALIEYDFGIQQLQLALRKQNLTDDQVQSILHLGRRKYEQEKSQHEVTLLKELIRQKKVLDSLQSVHIPIPSYIETIHDPAIRQELSERHQKIMQQYKNEMMKSFGSMAEIYMVETEKVFNQEMGQLWKNQRTLPLHQRFTSIVLNLIEQHLGNTTKTIESIYKYKIFQSFGTIST